MSITLKTVIFMGSAKNVSPPWGGEARVGDRALKLVQDTLASRSNTIGEVAVTHEVTTYDPLVVFGEGGALSHSGAEMRAPTFYQKPEELNEATTAMLQTIKGCDAILCVTAEYNHSVPPGLQSLLSHFGGSCYMCKPSGIVTYSVGKYRSK
jgi:NAD(P)H-dependent FMN reductase